MVRTEVVMV